MSEEAFSQSRLHSAAVWMGNEDKIYEVENSFVKSCKYHKIIGLSLVERIQRAC